MFLFIANSQAAVMAATVNWIVLVETDKQIQNKKQGCSQQTGKAQIGLNRQGIQVKKQKQDKKS